MYEEHMSHDICSAQAQTSARNIIYLCLEVIEDGKLFVVSNIWV